MSPPPRRTVSEWADSERRLSPEASAEAGWWRTDRAAYQRGIMDAVNDPAIENIVIMSAAQIGKTEILLNILGYYISHDPSPILVLQPTLSLQEYEIGFTELQESFTGQIKKPKEAFDAYVTQLKSGRASHQHLFDMAKLQAESILEREPQKRPDLSRWLKEWMYDRRMESDDGAEVKVTL
jgi:hypothetical protein